MSNWRSQRTEGAFSGLFMRIDGSDTELAVDAMQGRPVLATTDWHQVLVVLDVPSNAVGMSLGAVFNGSGQLFVDDLALDIVDVSVPTTSNVIDDPLPMPGIGARYQNAPLAPVNLDFETVTRASASTMMARTGQRAALNHRSGQ